MYYEPLCYQLFTQTENQNNWYNETNKSLYGRIYTIISKTVIRYLNFLELNKSHNGYSTAYALPRIIFIIFIIMFIYIILKIKQYYRKY